MVASTFANRILARLPRRELTAIAAHLVPVTLSTGEIIYATGDRIDRVYFPEDSIVVLMIELADGRGVDGAVVGLDGVVGVGGSLADQRSFTTQRVQRGGSGYSIKQSAFGDLLEECEAFQTVVQSYRDAFTAHLLQSIACNAAHAAEERLARWLLGLLDISPSPRLPVTHETLAGMVGCNRPTVTLGLRKFETAGLIETRRGSIEVVDRPGLEAQACTCYEFIRGVYENVHGRGRRGAKPSSGGKPGER